MLTCSPRWLTIFWYLLNQGRRAGTRHGEGEGRQQRVGDSKAWVTQKGANQWNQGGFLHDHKGVGGQETQCANSTGELIKLRAHSAHTGYVTSLVMFTGAMRAQPLAQVRPKLQPSTMQRHSSARLGT